MSHIRSKATKPEILVRKWLWAHGYRYRLNVKSVPGKPDIVMRRYRTAIFVNGCFWHGHDGCRQFVLPKTNTPFWQAKIDLLIERNDNIVNMCEMKFYSEEFTVSKAYHKTLVHRSNLLLEHLSPKMAIHPILITTYGLTHNEYSREFINCVTFNELFES